MKTQVLVLCLLLHSGATANEAHQQRNVGDTLIERIDDSCAPAEVRTFALPQPPAEEGAHVLVTCTDGTGQTVPLEKHDFVAPRI